MNYTTRWYSNGQGGFIELAWMSHRDYGRKSYTTKIGHGSSDWQRKTRGINYIAEDCEHGAGSDLSTSILQDLERLGTTQLQMHIDGGDLPVRWLLGGAFFDDNNNWYPSL